MSRFGNYPPGAALCSWAPYNEVEIEPEIIDVEVLYTLRKKDEIGVYDCEYEYDENGIPRGPYFDESDMEGRWKDQKFTPERILKNIVRIYEEIRKNGWSKELQYDIRTLAEESENWVEDYIEVNKE